MSLPTATNANVTIRAPRKCGHCRQPGHNVFTCPDLAVYTNTLYGYARDQIQRDVLENGNGEIFEQWVNELSETDLKYLVWQITNTHHFYDMLHNRTILYNHFASLDIGYYLVDMRRVRNYFRVYQIAELDVRYNSNGAELHNYLNNVLSESQMDDVYFKIMSNDNNNIQTSEIYQREFQYWFNRPGLMSHKQLVIHCHFVELDIGYDFHLQNIPGYNIQGRNRQREERRVAREHENENEITTIIKPDLLTVVFTNHNTPYPIQQQIEYPLYKNKNDSIQQNKIMDCCAICMETKDKKDCLTTECNHDFCSLCIGKMIIHCMQTSVKMDCPLCRTKLTCFTYCDETTIHNII